MGHYEDAKAAQARMETGLTNVAADIRRLVDAVPPTGGMTEEQASELKTSMTAMAERVESIAAIVPETETPPPAGEEL